MEINKLGNISSVQQSNQSEKSNKLEHDNKYIGELITNGTSHAETIGRSMVKVKTPQKTDAQAKAEVKNLMESIGCEEFFEKLSETINADNVEFIKECINQRKEKFKNCEFSKSKGFNQNNVFISSLNRYASKINSFNKDLALGFAKDSFKSAKNVFPILVEIDSPQKLQFAQDVLFSKPCSFVTDYEIMLTEKTPDGFKTTNGSHEEFLLLEDDESEESQRLFKLYNSSPQISVEYASYGLKNINKVNAGFVKELGEKYPQYIDISKYLNTEKDIELAQKVLFQKDAKKPDFYALEACFRGVNDLEFSLKNSLGLDSKKLRTKIIDMILDEMSE